MRGRGDEREPAVIGVPQCLDTRGRWRPGRDYLYADRAYAAAIDRAGGVALHLPVQAGASLAARARALVERIDGLLIPGGDDFLPDACGPPGARRQANSTGSTDSAARYSAEVFDPAPAEQIDFDAALLAATVEAGKPLLGICYGMQLLALHFGGRLYPHLPVDVPNASEHRLPADGGRHAIEVVAGSRLALYLGAADETGANVDVNSLHHQAVAEPGDGLRVCARAADGVVEAIEGATPPEPTTAPLLGVQWHPERLAGPAGSGLIASFVRAAAALRETRATTG